MATLHYKTKKSYTPDKGEDYSEESSMTIQGDTMSIKEILARYKAGQDLPRSGLTYFDQQLEMINEFYQPGALDLTDLQRFRESIQELERAVEEKQKELEESEEPDKSEEPEEPTDPEA